MTRAPRCAAIVTLVLCAFAVYQPALSAYFFDDDFQWLAGSLSFHPSQLVAFGSLTHFYRPVIDLYFAAATPLFGGLPLFFHLSSIALHAATGLVVFALARLMSRRTLYGFVAALFFVVQPADIDAVAWVGALAEVIGALFGSVSLYGFLKWRETARTYWRVCSVGAFVLALLTHESSVVFLPVLALADWAFVPASGEAWSWPERRREWSRLARAYAPYLVATAAYLSIDLVINARNYVVAEGHYALGPHIVRHAFEYLAALYVGRRDALNYAFITVGVALLLGRGSRRVRFATLWMLLALAPFLAFTWGNTSRYLYQPAIGFSMLLAEAMIWLAGARVGRVPPAVRRAVVTVLIAGIAIRFATFAVSNIESFAMGTVVYRSFVADVLSAQKGPLSDGVITLDPGVTRKLPHSFANAAVQWAYRDVTIRLAPYEPE